MLLDCQSEPFQNFHLQWHFTLEETKAWIVVEKNDNLTYALVHNSCNLIEETSCAPSHMAQSIEHVPPNDDDDNSTVTSASISIHVKITAISVNLEYICYNCNLSNVSVLLLKVKQKACNQKLKRHGTLPYQLLPAELWEKNN